MASLVHEESSLLAQQARAQAIAQGENIVIDTVLGNATYAAEIGASLRNAGYEVTLVEVEVRLEDSVARTQHRWREGYVAAEAGNGPALGGRWVPEELPASLYDTGQSDSRCRSIASNLAQQQSAVRTYEEHRVDPGTGSPTLEARYERASSGSALMRVPGVGISDGLDSIRNVLRAQNGSGRGAGSASERQYKPPAAGPSTGLER